MELHPFFEGISDIFAELHSRFLDLLKEHVLIFKIIFII